MVRVMRPELSAQDFRTVKPPPKTVDEDLTGPEYDYWRGIVMRRAHWQCEAIDNGTRCPAKSPKERLYADHIIERSDGGEPYDPDNGQCLCARHHSLKTAEMRRLRAAGII